MHVRRLAVQVDRYDRPGSGRNAVFNSMNIDVVGLRINVHKNGCCAGMYNRFSRSDEAVGSSDDFVALTDAQCSKGQDKSIGTIADTDGAPDFAELCERLLKPFDASSPNESTAIQCLIPGPPQIVAKSPMLVS